MAAGYLLVQLTEDKRVETAENMAVKETLEQVYINPNQKL